MNNEIFNALKKCNQIGKKLSPDSKYILISGMMLSYSNNNYEEQLPNNVSVVSIDEKLLSKLEGLPYIGIEINGNELYQMEQSGEFIRFEIDSENVYLFFLVKESNMECFIKSFISDAAKLYNCSEKDVKKSISENFANNIDLYEFFTKYKKEHENDKYEIIKKVSCKIINTDKCRDIKIINSVIDDIYNSNIAFNQDLSQDMCDTIGGLTRPFDIQFDGTPIRIMKSLFKISPKEGSNIKVVVNKKSYLLITFKLNGCTLCNIYRLFYEDDK